MSEGIGETDCGLLDGSVNQLTEEGIQEKEPTEGPAGEPTGEKVNRTIDNRVIDSSGPKVSLYSPVEYHWFYFKDVDGRETWCPFSVSDSKRIEEAYLDKRKLLTSKADCETDTIVSTNGGRYDVYIEKRIRKPIFWVEETNVVRRCSWFYREEGQSTFTPYTEEFADLLEEKYKEAVLEDVWNVRIDIPGEGQFLQFNSPSMLRHYQIDLSDPSDWNDVTANPVRPRVVHRGIQSFDIDAGEPRVVDHLVFIVHGVGSVCDLKFRTLTEVVDGFRAMSLSLLRHHFKDAYNNSSIGRVEFLPVSWHTSLHGDATGIDDRLKLITLKSTPKLREFSNDTILDALFYTSPVYCQTIIDSVASEMNRLYALFLNRNSSFSGSVAVVGHSLGSLILFDLLAHQDDGSRVSPTTGSPQRISSLDSLLETLALHNLKGTFHARGCTLDTVLKMTADELHQLSLPQDAVRKILAFGRTLQREKSTVSSDSLQTMDSAASGRASVASVSYNSFGSPGTGCPFIKYAPLNFSPDHFFALGSPISMFLTVRGMENLKEDFRLPTCPQFYNIFHPFDPIAYRIEPLIKPEFVNIEPVVIPHHKGRKRMHLELKENIVKVGFGIKEVFGSLRQTWTSINGFARRHSSLIQAKSVDNINSEKGEDSKNETTLDEPKEKAKVKKSTSVVTIGQLNRGQRIDYVLQETPIEFLNEYVFALSSHLCYWESEDTVLFLLKKLYSASIHSLLTETRSRSGSLQNMNE